MLDRNSFAPNGWETFHVSSNSVWTENKFMAAIKIPGFLHKYIFRQNTKNQSNNLFCFARRYHLETLYSIVKNQFSVKRRFLLHSYQLYISLSYCFIVKTIFNWTTLNFIVKTIFNWTTLYFVVISDFQLNNFIFHCYKRFSIA